MGTGPLRLAVACRWHVRALDGVGADPMLLNMHPPCLPHRARPRRIEKLLQTIDGMEAKRRRLARGALTAACLAVGWAWYQHVYLLPKVGAGWVGCFGCCLADVLR